MVLRKIINFGDWTELTEAGNGFVDSSNPAETNHPENDVDNVLFSCDHPTCTPASLNDQYLKRAI